MKLVKINYRLFIILIISTLSPFPQSSVKLMNYNLLNYPGTDITTRNPNFREIIASANPDIIAVQEITSKAGVDGFKNNVLFFKRIATKTLINHFRPKIFGIKRISERNVKKQILFDPDIVG
ncbi:MAG: hypothetical protein P8Y79_16100 [Ignavibacteriaceae bacterium]